MESIVGAPTEGVACWQAGGAEGTLAALRERAEGLERELDALQGALRTREAQLRDQASELADLRER